MDVVLHSRRNRNSDLVLVFLFWYFSLKLKYISCIFWSSHLCMNPTMADFQETLQQLTAKDADGVPGAVMLALQDGKGASLPSSMPLPTDSTL